MKLTKSEQLFEEWCRQADLRWARLPECSEKRPDYEIHLGSVRVFVEVKQLDPNDEEKVLSQKQARGEVVVFGSLPGERVRREIREANRQLRKVAGSLNPAIVIVFNNTPCYLHTDPYGIMTAMLGIDTVEVLLLGDASERPRFGRTRSGGERAMRPDANTSISAVGVLYRAFEEAPCIDLFHNRFSKCSLHPDNLRCAGVRHFHIPPNAANSLGEWKEV